MTFQEIYQDVKSQANTFIEDIAKLTHRSKAAVRKWIAGECAPDMNVQEKLSKYFEKPIEELHRNEGWQYANGVNLDKVFPDAKVLQWAFTPRPVQWWQESENEE